MELYSSEWEASVNGKNIDPTNHFLVNSYANGWLIQTAGNYDINITFMPQRILELGKKVTLVSVVVMLVVIAISLVIKKRHEIS